MVTISVIGSGNVAFHLINALQKAPDIQLIQVCAREKRNLLNILDSTVIVSNIADLKPVDICIIAVSDDAITEVSKSILFENKIVAHTSGSIGINDLSAKNKRAVFYPLQTFSKDKAIDFTAIPICLESEHLEDYLLLKKVASSISKFVYSIDSKQRKALHISAVFVNNFVNQLYQIGYEICDENNIPFDLLKPLILETAEKIKILTPREAQTGPAKRKDDKTIASHFAFLTDKKKKDIYTLMTQTIQNNE